jgi:hypothetical protein
MTYIYCSIRDKHTIERYFASDIYKVIKEVEEWVRQDIAKQKISLLSPVICYFNPVTQQAIVEFTTEYWVDTIAPLDILIDNKECVIDFH